MLARNPKTRIALLVLEGEETDPLTGEVVLKNEKPVGTITSSAYGHTVGKSLEIAFFTDEIRVAGTKLSVLMLGKQTKVTVLKDAPWDPENKRLKV